MGRRNGRLFEVTAQKQTFLMRIVARIVGAAPRTDMGSKSSANLPFNLFMSLLFLPPFLISVSVYRFRAPMLRMILPIAVNLASRSALFSPCFAAMIGGLVRDQNGSLPFQPPQASASRSTRTPLNLLASRVIFIYNASSHSLILFRVVMSPSMLTTPKAITTALPSFVSITRLSYFLSSCTKAIS